MTTQPFQVDTSVINPSNNPYIGSLLWGGWRWGDPENPSAQTEISYYFYSPIWLTYEIAAFEIALKTWSNVANIVFSRTTDFSAAQLREDQNSSLNALGQHETPEHAYLHGSGAALGIFNYLYWSQASLQPGGYDFITFVHEIGHGLGLAHPHDDGGSSGQFPGVDYYSGGLGDNDLNQGIFSVMSYNDGWVTSPDALPDSVSTYGYQAGPMAFDIAAIQALYGANTTHNVGNNVYAVPTANKAGTYYSCIWDAGGTDEIKYGGSRSVTIDLRSATLDNSSTGGGVVSYASGIYGGYTIANGAVIENATGGSGADKLRGNEVSNKLSGGSGNDTLIGGGGGDNYIGGSGVDTVSYADATEAIVIDLLTQTNNAGAAAGDRFATVESILGTIYADRYSGSAAADIFYGGDGQDIAVGDAGNDKLEGGDGADWLLGGKGNDNLVGGDSGDHFDGGEGIDSVSYASATDAVYVNLSTLSGDQSAIGDTYEFQTIEIVTGSIWNDTLIGDAKDNQLFGMDGEDTISGESGNDKLDGGVGIDTLSYEAATAGVTVSLATRSSQNTVGAGKDAVSGFENVVGSTFGDKLTGDTGTNTLMGGNGIDWLYGREGADFLIGGADADMFVFNTKLTGSFTDSVLDFEVGVDHISLSKSIFAGVGKAGQIADTIFVIGSAALDADDRVIYNADTGYIVYDKNGSVAGGDSNVVYVGHYLDLTAADILIV